MLEVAAGHPPCQSTRNVKSKEEVISAVVEMKKLKGGKGVSSVVTKPVVTKCDGAAEVAALGKTDDLSVAVAVDKKHDSSVATVVDKQEHSLGAVAVDKEHSLVAMAVDKKDDSLVAMANKDN